MIPEFFIDTADISYINALWDKMNQHTSPQMLAGITTNPNCLDKVKCATLAQLEDLLPRLCKTVSDIRGDDKGVVYVQVPSCDMSVNQMLNWVDFVKPLSDSKTRIALKIPPYSSVLRKLQAVKMDNIIDINVTGVADATTALMCFSFPMVKYVSIISGRMEEVGIDANAHLQYVYQRYGNKNRVITGSMRTKDGLRRAIDCYTSPTIGTRVWDLFTPQDFAEFPQWWQPAVVTEQRIAPMTDDRNVQLSLDFFKQMNALGAPMHKEFVK